MRFQAIMALSFCIAVHRCGVVERVEVDFVRSAGRGDVESCCCCRGLCDLLGVLTALVSLPLTEVVVPSVSPFVRRVLRRRSSAALSRGAISVVYSFFRCRLIKKLFRRENTAARMKRTQHGPYSDRRPGKGDGSMRSPSVGVF